MKDEQDEQEQLLQPLRQRIDAIDRQLLQLFNDRARCALEVADIKARFAREADPVFYRPEREVRVLRNLMQANPGPLPDEQVAYLFRQLISSCLALEEPMVVAYLGPEATFTQLAALKHFGNSIVDKPIATVDDVFRDVAAGNSHYGVVPVENSSEGVISHTLDNFLESRLLICGEVELRIHQHLMVTEGTEAQGIERIYSHQQSLAQCRRWLDIHYPKVPRIAVVSNAEAARRIGDEPGSAAIAGDMAAEHYKRQIVANKIESRTDNTTRFLVIGREAVRPCGLDKTSIMVSTRNKPGALFHVLEPFHRHEVSLTAIETRPSPAGLWSYVFFIDFEGHQEDEPVRKAIAELESGVIETKILGSYPKAFSADGSNTG